MQRNSAGFLMETFFKYCFDKKLCLKEFTTYTKFFEILEIFKGKLLFVKLVT